MENKEKSNQALCKIEEIGFKVEYIIVSLKAIMKSKRISCEEHVCLEIKEEIEEVKSLLALPKNKLVV